MAVSVRARFPVSSAWRNKRAENRTDVAMLGRTVPCGADLTEDLMLAHDRRVEPSRDGEEVANRLGIVQGVEMVGDVFRREAGVATDELSDVLVAAMEPLGIRVDLDTVAGGEHDDFGKIVGRAEIGERLRDVVGRDRHPLEHGERSRPVITTDGDDRHGRKTSGCGQAAGQARDGRSHLQTVSAGDPRA